MISKVIGNNGMKPIIIIIMIMMMIIIIIIIIGAVSVLRMGKLPSTDLVQRRRI